MSGWRKRQIADQVENDMTIIGKLVQWYEENNVEITWFLIGILSVGTLDQLAKGQYWSAAINFFLIVVNYLLRKEGFGK